MLEHLAAAQRHAGQRIIGDRDGQAGMVANFQIQTAQLGAAAGQHDALIGNI